MANRTVESLWRWSDSGKLPIVCDATSCSLGLTSEIVEYLTPENRERYAQLKIFDSVAWAHDRLLPKLKIRHKAASAVVHTSRKDLAVYFVFEDYDATILRAVHNK